MERAIVTLLHAGGTAGGDIRFAAMAAVLGKSIEQHAPGIPLIVIVAGEFDEAALEPLKVVSDDTLRILRKPLLTAGSGGSYWRGNLSKVHAWSLAGFDKVLFLDADCWLKASPLACFDLPEFTVCPGPEAPLNGARIVLQPSNGTFAALRTLIDRYSFSEAAGWEGAGEFIWPDYPTSPKPGQRSDWKFNAAENDQGLFWYYFGLLKHSLSYHGCGELVRAADHIGRGEHKFSLLPPEYKKLVDDLNFEGYFGA